VTPNAWPGLARGLVERCRRLSSEIAAVDKELQVLVRPLAPALFAVCGCAAITAAKIVGETADVRRFRSRHTIRAPRAFLERRRATGDTKAESIRALKRRLSDVIYRALLIDAELNAAPPTVLDIA
jgi:transposase